MNKHTIILIYGIPCSGKTTLLHLLSQKLHCPTLKIDDFWQLCIKAPKYSKEESNLVFDHFLMQIEKKSINNQTLIVEGAFVTIERFDKIECFCLKKNIILIPILMFPSLDVVKERLLKRNTTRDVGIPLDRIDWFFDILRSDKGSFYKHKIKVCVDIIDAKLVDSVLNEIIYGK